MNKLFLLLTVLLASTSIHLAQNFEGKILSKLDYDLPEAMEAQRSMLPTDMTTYIGKDFSRVEQKTMMGDQIFITNFSDSSTILLLNMMGKMMAITITPGDSKGEDKGKEPKIEYVDETKDIAGFTCKKAIVTMEDENGEEMQTEVYYTEEIPARASDKIKGLKGFPLQYTILAQGMTMTVTATTVSKEKVSKKLKEVPEGYEKMTMAEFQNMMGGGQ